MPLQILQMVVVVTPRMTGSRLTMLFQVHQTLRCSYSSDVYFRRLQAKEESLCQGRTVRSEIRWKQRGSEREE